MEADEIQQELNALIDNLRRRGCSEKRVDSEVEKRAPRCDVCKTRDWDLISIAAPRRSFRLCYLCYEAVLERDREWSRNRSCSDCVRRKLCDLKRDLEKAGARTLCEEHVWDDYECEVEVEV